MSLNPTIFIYAIVLVILQGSVGSPVQLREHASLTTTTKLKRQTYEEHVDAVVARTPYPAAGFRPKIPFELPGERRSKSFPLPGISTRTTTDWRPIVKQTTTTTTPTTTTTAATELIPIQQEATTAKDFNEIENAETTTIINSFPTAITTETTLEGEEEDGETASKLNFDKGHIPASTYGPPNSKSDNDDDVLADDTPPFPPTSNFQPPIYEAVKDFHATLTKPNAATNFNVNTNLVVVADLPATESTTQTRTTKWQKGDDSTSGGRGGDGDRDGDRDVPSYDGPRDQENRDEESNENEAKQQQQEQPNKDLDEFSLSLQQPADTYGPPQFNINRVPAETYGAPQVYAPEDDLASLNEDEVELLNNNFNDLQNGRLIFVPSDGSQLRQLYVAPINTSSRDDDKLNVASFYSGRKTNRKERLQHQLAQQKPRREH